jgi:hypothetical protein
VPGGGARAYVGRRAGLFGRRGVDPLGEAEVEDLHVPVVRHEDVVRFEVAMNDVAAVRRGEPARDLEPPLDRLPLRDRRAVELAAQRLALEQLGDRVGDPLVRPEVEDREDVRMRQRGDGLGLALEAREASGLEVSCAGSTLTATSRSSLRSRAR